MKKDAEGEYTKEYMESREGEREQEVDETLCELRPQLPDLTVVTREDFEAYVEVQMEGSYNMFDPQAREATGLTKEQYFYVLKHYRELKKKYGLSD